MHRCRSISDSEPMSDLHMQVQRPLTGLRMCKWRDHCSVCTCANAEATVRPVNARMQRPLSDLHMHKCRGHCQVCTWANAEATVRSAHSQMQRPLLGLHLRKFRVHCQVCTRANSESTAKSAHAQMQRPLPGLRIRIWRVSLSASRTCTCLMQRQFQVHIPKGFFQLMSILHVVTASSYIYESDLFLRLFTGLSLLICLCA